MISFDLNDPFGGYMNRNLTLEATRLTELSALYASRYMGKGDDELCYRSSDEAMWKLLEKMDIEGDVIIGAANRDLYLYDGRKVGTGDGPKVDIAVKPLEGKRTCALGGHNSISVVAIGGEGSFMKVPPCMMQKIAVGPDAKGVVDINQPPDINIKRVARAKGKYIEDITVCVLDREINWQLVEDIRKTGARISFITDGDISGVISTAIEDSSIDIMMGVGGAKEAVTAAAGLKCLGGDMQAKVFYNDYFEKTVAENLGRGNADRIYKIRDLVRGDDILIAITGVTDGVLLPGVRYFSGGARTNSIVIRQQTHTVRFINAIHKFDYKPIF
ncbi:MAG TPA: class II fructose-bisphosphatase [Spirochaetota bacterium]|nr:class II fructose-bisphosphatase [Spirochaetota bacterium]HPJ34834.1 class II fructose-bisphosphatase [Spirochaetota bacterium]